MQLSHDINMQVCESVNLNPPSVKLMLNGADDLLGWQQSSILDQWNESDVQNVQLLCLHGSTQTDFTEECEGKLDYLEFKVKENCTKETGC